MDYHVYNVVKYCIKSWKGLKYLRKKAALTTVNQITGLY